MNDDEPTGRLRVVQGGEARLDPTRVLCPECHIAGRYGPAWGIQVHTVLHTDGRDVKSTSSVSYICVQCLAVGKVVRLS